MDNPYPWLQDFINQVPEFLQPVMVALVAAIPYIEGEAAAAFGIIAGINPIVAALAAITGNVLCVIGVVVLGSRIRGGVVARRSARGTSAAPAARGAATSTTSSSTTSSSTTVETLDDDSTGSSGSGEEDTTRRGKGKTKLRRWLVRFGVPGASILAPIALPTMLTAAFFVASGVRKEWVILWQIVAIVLWTGLVAAAATGLLALLGW
ncbi:small multidrug efflux protein [Microbacterium sp. WCS2018Hpa-23]|uniref:small multidrug efflux protein n=1 Tax=Microbacterium sp. WCS2018Hpa-23 TaxID=3073634 RepID=UPI0028833544|nr:small multidrug efflux protein [Microbacterium sp. WCS2018Hpa-23]